MILIADSGSTKTDWCVASDGKEILHIKTAGMNPFFQSAEEMEQELRKALLPALGAERPEKVYFYGAGCLPEKIESVRTVLTKVLKVSAEVESDLLGAARALCGHRPGIACILGTGSNSCFYDGEQIVKNVSPLGYVLGDEAGGAHLGRSLVREYLRGNLSPVCEKAFFDAYGLQKAEILDRVYKRPFPNRFLAGFAPFILPYLNEPGNEKLRGVIKNCFRDFFRNCVMQYDFKKLNVNAIGSVAWHFREIIAETAQEEGIGLGIIHQSPMEGLVSFHA